jgi:hypothetical protein
LGFVLSRLASVIALVLAVVVLTLPATTAPVAVAQTDDPNQRAADALIRLIFGGAVTDEEFELLAQAFPGNHVAIDGGGDYHLIDGDTPIPDARLDLDLSAVTQQLLIDDPPGDAGDGAPDEIDIVRASALRLNVEATDRLLNAIDRQYQARLDGAGDYAFSLPPGSDRVPALSNDFIVVWVWLAASLTGDDPYTLLPTVPQRIQFNLGFVHPDYPAWDNDDPNLDLNFTFDFFRPGGGDVLRSGITQFDGDSFSTSESPAIGAWYQNRFVFLVDAAHLASGATNIVVQAVDFPNYDRVVLAPSLDQLPALDVNLWDTVDQNADGILDALEDGDGAAAASPTASATSPEASPAAGSTGEAAEDESGGGVPWEFLVPAGIVAVIAVVAIARGFGLLQLPGRISVPGKDCKPEEDAWRAAVARLGGAQSGLARANERLAELTARRERAEANTGSEDYFTRLTDALRDEGQQQSLVDQAQLEVERAQTDVEQTRLAYDICTGAAVPLPPPAPPPPPPPPPAGDTSDVDAPVIEEPARTEPGPAGPAVTTGPSVTSTTSREQVCAAGEHARYVVHDWTTFTTPRDGAPEVTVTVEGGSDSFDVDEDDPLRGMRDWADGIGALRADGSITIPSGSISGAGLDRFLENVSARLAFTIELERVHARCVQHLVCEVPPEEGRWAKMELDCEQRVESLNAVRVEWTGAGSTWNGRGVNSPGHAFDLISTELARAARGQAELQSFVQRCAASDGQAFTFRR